MIKNHTTSLLFLLFFAFNTALVSQDCQFSNTSYIIEECEDGDVFYIEIHFDVENPTADGFFVSTTGLDTFYTYGQEFYIFGPLPSDCTTLYEFFIQDAQQDSCFTSISLEEPICCEEPCEMIAEFGGFPDPIECDSLGYYNFVLEVINENPGDEGFDVYVDNVLYQHFDYNGTSYGFDVPGVGTYVTIKVVDTANPDCSDSFNIDILECENAEPCAFESFLWIETECVSENTYEVFAPIDYIGTADSMVITLYESTNTFPWSEELWVQTVAVEDFPASLGIFEVSNTLYYYSITDQDNPFCSVWNEWNDAPDCSDFSDECAFVNFEAASVECNPDNDEYYVLFAFNIENPGDNGYAVCIDSMVYDTFEYTAGRNRKVIGPFEGGCNTFAHVTIKDLDHHCATDTLIENACCDIEECFIGDTEVWDIECNNDGTINFNLNFIYENNTNDFFDLYSHNGLIGFYSYDDLPVRISGFEPRDAEFQFIRICDNDNPTCCKEFEFRSPDCLIFEDCAITELFAESYDCNGEVFYIDFEFNVEHPGSQGFIIAGNGIIHDTLEYGAVYYTIGPLELNCDMNYVLIVEDLEFNCSAVFEIGSPECCENESCEIGGLELYDFECRDNGTYDFTLFFEYEGNSSDLFDVFAGDHYIGTYEYQDLPVRIENFIPRDVEYDLIKVCDHAHPDCCEIHEFMGPDCGEHGECELGEIEIIEFICDEYSYDVVIGFEYANTDSDTYVVYVNGFNYGRFEYSDRAIRLDSIYPRTNTEYDIIKICDSENPECCTVIEYMQPDCIDEECFIEILEVFDVQLSAAGVLNLFAKIEYEAENNIGFDIFLNGEFQYFTRDDANPLPIELDGIEFPDSLLLEICVNDRPDCCDHIWIDAIIDHGSCELFEMTALQTICQDGFFYIVADAEHGFDNPHQKFVLRGNGRLYGEYTVSQLPVAIGPFHNEEEVNELVMIFTGLDEDCKDEIELDIDCDCITNIIEIDYEEFNIDDTSNQITISAASSSSFLVQLFNVDGRKLMESTAYGSYTINKSNYTPGIYIVRIIMNGQERSFKVFMSN